MYTTCIIWLAFVPLYFGTGTSYEVRISENNLITPKCKTLLHIQITTLWFHAYFSELFIILNKNIVHCTNLHFLMLRDIPKSSSWYPHLNSLLTWLVFKNLKIDFLLCMIFRSTQASMWYFKINNWVLFETV